MHRNRLAFTENIWHNNGTYWEIAEYGVTTKQQH